MHLRAAVVNKVNGCFEITFLKPIAHLKNMDEAWFEKGQWHETHYADYHASLPRAESCLFANKGEKEPFFTNCPTSSDYADFHGRHDFWYKLDARGLKVANKGGVSENVYVALMLTKEEFLKINPDVDFSLFDMSTCF